MKVCPKCKRKSGDEEQCNLCNIVFAEYERRKREETGQVYRLISTGELAQAKELAQLLSTVYPDSKGDFILLISNINRDLNIADKYRQAQELLNKGEHGEALSLLRNLKAFDPGLSEKVLTLRRRAERQFGNSSKLEQAAELFEQKQYSQAKTILLQISGDSRRKEEADKLLAKIEEIKSGLLRDVTDCLIRNLFNAASERLNSLISIFPEAKQECAPLFALIERRKEISVTLAVAASKAKDEKRLLEAKVLYAFLLWQDQELRSSLLPHLEGIGSQPQISLADCGQSDAAAWAALGIQVTEQGVLKPVPTEQDGRSDAQAANIAPVLASLPSVADFACEPVNIDGEEVADFA